MLKLEFSPQDIKALCYWRFHHPPPQVQLKMEAVYLRGQKLENKRIQQICGISKATFYRYLHEYREGGVERLKELNFHRQESELGGHKPRLEDYFREHPPARVAEASAKIEEMSGIRRGPTQTRKFLEALGMKPRKVGQIPSKAAARARSGQRSATRTAFEGSQSGPAAGFLYGCRAFCLGPVSGAALEL
jgi:transposase